MSEEKKYENRTITLLFPNDKFGDGALLSAELGAPGYDLVQTLKLGDKLVLRRIVDRDGNPRKTKKGGDMFSLDIVKFNPQQGRPAARNNRSSL